MSVDRLAKAVQGVGDPRMTQHLAVESIREMLALHITAAMDGPVVDVTPLFRDLEDGVKLYEFREVAPPWPAGILTFYRGAATSVIPFVAYDRDNPIPGTEDRMITWRSDHVTDWEGVRWRVIAPVYLRGVARDGEGERGGVAALVIIAVNDDGDPVDIWRETFIGDGTDEGMDSLMATEAAVLLSCFQFMNCRNVEIVEPVRPRAERRRLERMGAPVVHEIVVTRMGKSYRSGPGGEPSGVSPLTTVRGHFAEYGPRYGKGLLFGKYEGRFWVPFHARGSGDDSGARVYSLEDEPT